MKKFWCVSSKFFDTGRVKATMFQVEAENKPQNEMTETERYDEYLDFFNTHSEARDFWQDMQYV